ncbi:MAG TPA: hypothetical protein DDW30_07295 [Clostridiales bacterium]|nr:hypothetical protein [Clostridiales bacterium]
MRKLRIFSLVLALLMILPLAVACKKVQTVEYEAIDPADAVEHDDFTSVYDMIGSKVTIDMVEEDSAGMAYVTVDGVKYTLGMDFLSMAMVYNTKVPEGSTTYKTEEDVYNMWWKLYIQRWNYLAPEIPLYSNIYYDLYNAKIKNFETTPYWGPEDAIIAATSDDGKVILGSTTDLSGAFRYAAWGKSSPGASDLDIQNLTSGYATVMSGKDGSYVWNEIALAKDADGKVIIPTSKVNEDGTLTYTIKVANDLTFSDKSPITAKNYITYLLANSTAVAGEAGGTANAGNTLVGFDAFKAYDGTNDGKEVVLNEKTGAKVTASKTFKGVRLVDDYTFEVTFTADYAGYYYAIVNAAFSPDPEKLYLGANGAIETDADGYCYLNDAFYAKKDGKYTTADEIKKNLEWNSGLPFSGPYVVSDYNESSKIATLTLNKEYKGDIRGKATIETISYIKVVSQTQMDMFQRGEVDVIAGITGGDETNAALKIVSDNKDKYKETHYDRAGYGKLGFRADFGPTGMVEVRQAIMYTINRPEFAQTFTGGHGSVVHGPYYTGFSAYQANKDTIKLNQYTYSSSSAIDVLVAGGWIYNEKGEEFKAGTDAVRYKKLSGYELSKDNLNFQSKDGKYKTVKIKGEYYMPLAINWYGTADNPVTDQLLTAWQKNPASTTEIGMYITYTLTDFTTGLYGELQRDPDSGYNGTPMLNAINFASGFTSAVYDYAFNWSIDPNYEVYSACYIKDEADFYSNYTK